MTVSTAPNPGAVAIIDLMGPGCTDLLSRLSHQRDWSTGTVHLISLPGIDTAAAVVLTDQHAQVMPHGGPRVVQRVVNHLASLGAAYDAHPATPDRYCETRDGIEADMLGTIARARSPAAIDLLLSQPRLWRQWLGESASAHARREEILAHSALLDRLVDPARVVVVGKPNVGKSTLHNHMAGRDASVVSDVPGTTRDWVGDPVTLQGHGATMQHESPQAVVVDWTDTPGLRTEGERAEHEARQLAEQVMRTADLLITIRDLDSPWPDPTGFPGKPDLWVVNKCDLAPPMPGGDGRSAETPIAISAAEGTGIDVLERAVLDHLGLYPIPAQVCWAFSEPLRQTVRDESMDSLATYLGHG